VFCDAEEEDLGKCLKRAADIYCGLSAREVRKFVFGYPQGWRDTKMAGTEWLQIIRPFLCPNLRQKFSVEHDEC